MLKLSQFLLKSNLKFDKVELILIWFKIYGSIR